MSWLSRFAGITDHFKLDILMTFNIRTGQGVAALRWNMVQPHRSLNEENCKVMLVALLYARTLVNHEETRSELFNRMARAAQRVLQGDGDMTFEPWKLHAAGMDFSIWPWLLTEPELVIDAKTYIATLQSSYGGSLGIHLKMAFGQERILAPAAALIAASGLASALDVGKRLVFAEVLLGINAHYQSPQNISIGSEPAALKAALIKAFGHS